MGSKGQVILRKNYKCELKRSCQLSFRICCINGKIKHINLPADNVSLQPHYCLQEREVETQMITY